MNTYGDTKNSVQRFSMPIELPQDIAQNELEPHVLEEKRKIVERLYAIFNKKGAINNDQLLREFDECIKNVERSLSEEEESELNSFLQNKNRLQEGIQERGFVDFDTFTLQADWDNTFYEEVIEHQGQENDIRANSWKIDAIFALTHMKEKLEKRREEIEDFKSGNTSRMYAHLKGFPKILTAIEKGLTRIIYTPFGITILVPDSYTHNTNCGGFHVNRSPISVVYFGKNKRGKVEVSRSTLEHETRHTIFDILNLEGQFQLDHTSLRSRITNFITKIPEWEKKIAHMKEIGMPEFMIAPFRKNRDIQNLNIVDDYLKGLKDEILANFDLLINGFGSTDMNHSQNFLRFFHHIDAIFEPYKDNETIYAFKDELKNQSQERMEGFYQQISFYFFIARNGTPEIKETIRQLFYLADMRNLVGVNVALEGMIGDTIYLSLQKTYPIVTGIRLDDTLLGKNPQNTRIFALEMLDIMIGKGFGSKDIDQQKFRYLKKDGKIFKKYLSDAMLEAIYTTYTFFAPQNQNLMSLRSLSQVDPQIRRIKRDIIQSLDTSNPWKQKFIDLK